MTTTKFNRIGRTLYEVIRNGVSIGTVGANPYGVNACGLDLTSEERFALQMQARRDVLPLL